MKLNSKNRHIAAEAIIVDSDNRILLTQREDVPFWVLPGGGREKNESVEKCAIREVREEVGLDVRIVRRIAEYVLDSDRRKVLFLAKMTNSKQLKLDHSEVRRGIWCQADNLPTPISLMTIGKINDFLEDKGVRVTRRKLRINIKSEVVHLLKKPWWFVIILIFLIKNRVTKNTFRIKH